MNRHAFHRRRWTTLVCLECLRPWPCAAFRDALPRRTPIEQVEAAVYLADEARRVVREGVRIAAPTLIDRFFWWLDLSHTDAAALAEGVIPGAPHAVE